MQTDNRLHALDAVRAFALLLGVVFHAGFSFIPGLFPGLWAATDSSPSVPLSAFLFTAHMFRMTLFFLVAGFFARMLHQRGGTRGFWSNRLGRILLPLIVGWLVVFPLTAAVWVWGLTRTFGAALAVEAAKMPAPAPGAFPWAHLWFLYYLLVLYAIVLTVRAAVVAVDRQGSLRRRADAVVDWLVRRRGAALALAVPAAAALYLRHDWIAWFGIPTPDQSVIPQVASLVGYGSAVAFGWLVHRQTGLLAVWGRSWPLHLAVALMATTVCLSMAGVTPTLAPFATRGAKFWFAVSYSIGIWCWSLAVIGLAVRFLSHGSAVVRYVADASYWIYLIHLPLVVALQILISRLPWHWSVKFPLVLVVSLAALFATYHYLVRSTFIGQFLNGRRYPRGRGRRPGSQGDQGHDSAPSQPSPLTPLATLTGVHKRYGKTVALAGLDLDVRPGELLALLGPNGAGKSTAISLWLGLLQPDAGAVQLLGGSPLDVETRRHIGVMMQEVGLTPELRVRELIALTASYYATPLTTDQTLELTRTQALANRPYAKLSAGQKRQVQFALAICGRPALLFLDEPTVGLDVEARETMWRAIRTMIAQGCSIVLTTHYLEEAEALADRVAVLAGGRLVTSGSVDEIRAAVCRKQISCATALGVDEVLTWPNVVAVRRAARRLEITVIDGEDVLRRLLASDAAVHDVEIRRAGLAEAFVELTKEAA